MLDLTQTVISHISAGTVCLLRFLSHRPLRPLSWSFAARLGVTRPPEEIFAAVSGLSCCRAALALHNHLTSLGTRQLRQPK